MYVMIKELHKDIDDFPLYFLVKKKSILSISYILRNKFFKKI